MAICYSSTTIVRFFWNRKIGLLIWITNQAPIDAGEIVVFKIEGRDIPIVHRVIKRHENTETGEVKILTKVSSLILKFILRSLDFWNFDFWNFDFWNFGLEITQETDFMWANLTSEFKGVADKTSRLGKLLMTFYIFEVTNLNDLLM